MPAKEHTDAPRAGWYEFTVEQLRTLSLAELNRLRMHDLRRVIADVAERERQTPGEEDE